MSVEAQLNDYLAASTLIPLEELARAKLAAQTAGVRLDQALAEFGLLTAAKLTELLESQFDIPPYSPSRSLAEPVNLPIPLAFMATKSMIPVCVENGVLELAMLDCYDDFSAKAVSLKTGLPVRRRRIDRVTFERLWSELYGDLPGSTNSFGSEGQHEDRIDDVLTLADAASDAPVVRFVQDTIRRAVSVRASDIHLKPLQRGCELLFRIDGRLEPQTPPDARMYASVVSRLKILSNLDIAERRLPQDGKISLTVAGEAVDVRVSTMAHIHGEGVVLRLLSRHLVHTSLADLGFSASVEAGLRTLTKCTDGLIVVTGPTGSGKSTTLHAILQRLIRPDWNIVTVEDPVEYRVEGISQIQVDEKSGLSFPRILRSLLRQDPDLILIGEIRDSETAAIAVQAALTGHVVLATLHTNSALAAVPRLIDMGVEPYLVAAVLRGVLAQRLVRRRCPACAPLLQKQLCTACGGSGQSGRVAIGELALLDDEIVSALAVSPVLSVDLRQRLRSRGYLPMREDAQAKLEAGEIDLQDLAAVA